MFRIHLTQVDAMATDAKVGVNISLTHSTQILLLKSVDTLTDSFEDFTAGLSKAQLSNVWTHEPVPIVIEGSDRLFIITSHHTSKIYTQFRPNHFVNSIVKKS